MNAKTRTLKIEVVGDSFYNKIKPRIRLSGQWLEEAGFKPGHRVEISSSKPGEMSLQFKEECSKPVDRSKKQPEPFLAGAFCWKILVT